MTEARHHQAATLCRTCPVLAACRGWADQLPARARPPGVLAGHIPHPAKGRPRKASA
ncbi:WhiB family transcriptional regulator [Gordonia iterans]